MSYIDRTSCRICKVNEGNQWGYCDACYDEKKVIQNQCRLAKNRGLPCDLTQEQWRGIVQIFNGHCAYCVKRPYDCLEHFIPLCLGGGTTITNCVPACHSCNDRKRNKHPDEVTRIPREALERVYEYLESLKTHVNNS